MMTNATYVTEKTIMETSADMNEALRKIEELEMFVEPRIKYMEQRDCYRAYFKGRDYYAKTKEDLMQILKNIKCTKKVKEVYEESLIAYKPISENTRKRNRQIWNQFLESLSTMSISDCTGEMMAAFLIDLTADHKLTKDNLDNVRTELNRCFRYAVDKKYIKTC